MKTQHEQWKAIAECNGEYYISDHGRVKSFKFGKEKIMKPGRGIGGYYTVAISIKGKKQKSHSIHRLVAQSFLPNLSKKKQVNHKDGDKSNNHAYNLEWVTPKENIAHAWKIGLYESTRTLTQQRESKPVIDIITGKKYDSLKLACKDINEPYSRHVCRNYYNSKLQRFFYL